MIIKSALFLIVGCFLALVQKSAQLKRERNKRFHYELLLGNIKQAVNGTQPYFPLSAMHDGELQLG